jgi:hypothetical protein
MEIHVQSSAVHKNVGMEIHVQSSAVHKNVGMEIHVQSSAVHKNVAGLKWFMGSQPSISLIIVVHGVPTLHISNYSGSWGPNPPYLWL